MSSPVGEITHKYTHTHTHTHRHSEICGAGTCAPTHVIQTTHTHRPTHTHTHSHLPQNYGADDNDNEEHTNVKQQVAFLLQVVVLNWL